MSLENTLERIAVALETIAATMSATHVGRAESQTEESAIDMLVEDQQRYEAEVASQTTQPQEQVSQDQVSQEQVTEQPSQNGMSDEELANVNNWLSQMMTHLGDNGAAMISGVMQNNGINSLADAGNNRELIKKIVAEVATLSA